MIKNPKLKDNITSQLTVINIALFILLFIIISNSRYECFSTSLSNCYPFVNATTINCINQPGLLIGTLDCNCPEIWLNCPWSFEISMRSIITCIVCLFIINIYYVRLILMIDQLHLWFGVLVFLGGLAIFGGGTYDLIETILSNCDINQMGSVKKLDCDKTYLYINDMLELIIGCLMLKAGHAIYRWVCPKVEPDAYVDM